MADKPQLDTGTGGFDVDGKVQTYDVGSDSTSPSTVNYDPGNVRVDKSLKDISPATKQTLGSYLSKQTMGNVTGTDVHRLANSYPLDPPTPGQADVSLRDPVTGAPTPPSKDGGKNSKKFWDPSSTGKKTPETMSSKSKLYEQVSTSIYVNHQDGNELLNSVTTNKDVTPIVDTNNPNTAAAVLFGGGPIKTSELDNTSIVGKYTQTIFNNRFRYDGNVISTTTPNLIEDINTQTNGATSGDISTKLFAKKYQMGSSAPLDADPSKRISFGQLAQVGTALGLRTGLELGSKDAGLNPSSAGTEAAAILPGISQLGISRINRQLLEARDVLNNLSDDPIKLTQLINPNENSWGSLNSALDQYSGISSFGMQLLTLALLAGIAVVVAALGAIFDLIGTNKPPGGKKDSNYTAGADVQGRYPIGAWRPRGKPVDTNSAAGIAKALLSGDMVTEVLFGLRQTRFPFLQAVARGAMAYFGVVGSIDNPGDIAASALYTTQNPGFIVITARSVNRAFLRIADYFKSLTDTFGTNVIAGVEKIFEFITVFKESRLIGALNVFAGLGDDILSDAPRDADKQDQHDDNGTYVDQDANNGFGLKFSRIDKAPNGARSSHYKNRLTGGLTLSWATHRSSDYLIKPSDFTSTLAANLSSIDGFKKLETNNNKYEVANPRISDKEREDFEFALNSEYFPFYFHDIRTNEIVSFHAFLSTLTDGFTASYDTAESFGRIEPIKIYKNTARKIDFSFIIAATSQADFDYMWGKINKLTTLLYPQYTVGKKVTANVNGGSYKFAVPFSQVPAAAPMVRVRIGDLIVSNYSKFDVARIFGAGLQDSEFNSTLTPAGAIGRLAIGEQAEENYVLKNWDKLGNKVFKIVSAGDSPEGSDKDVMNYFGAPGPGNKLLYEVVSVSGGIVLLKLVEPAAEDIPEEDTNLLPSLKDAYKKALATAGSENPGDYTEWTVFEDNPDPKQNYRDKKVANMSIASKTKLIQEFRNSLDADVQAALTKSTSYSGAVEEFMKPENNPITKSFKTTGGQGLAGFVESMQFDWMDKTTWAGVGESGYKAPKMCKVTISFAPIHDIAPGIGADGQNRAAIYPIGPHGKGQGQY